MNVNKEKKEQVDMKENPLEILKMSLKLKKKINQLNASLDMVEEGTVMEDVECSPERQIEYLSMYLTIHCSLNVHVLQIHRLKF